jgi:hypothetical protein
MSLLQVPSLDDLAKRTVLKRLEIGINRNSCLLPKIFDKTLSALAEDLSTYYLP